MLCDQVGEEFRMNEYLKAKDSSLQTAFHASALFVSGVDFFVKGKFNKIKLSHVTQCEEQEAVCCLRRRNPRPKDKIDHDYYSL